MFQILDEVSGGVPIQENEYLQAAIQAAIKENKISQEEIKEGVLPKLPEEKKMKRKQWKLRVKD